MKAGQEFIKSVARNLAIQWCAVDINSDITKTHFGVSV